MREEQQEQHLVVQSREKSGKNSKQLVGVGVASSSK